MEEGLYCSVSANSWNWDGGGPTRKSFLTPTKGGLLMVRTAQGWNSGTSESKLYKQSLEDHLSEGWWDEGGGGAGIQTLNGQRGKPLIPFPNLSFWTPPIRSLSGPFLPSPGSTPLFPSELSFWLISISLPTLPVSWNHPIPPKDGFQNSMHVSFSKKTYLSTSRFKNTKCRNSRRHAV